MRTRLKFAVLVLLSLVLFGCGQRALPVIASGADWGAAIATREGYYVPLTAAAQLVESTVRLEALRVVVCYEDGQEISLPLEFPVKIQRDAAYLHIEALPSLLGVEASVLSTGIILVAKPPDLMLNVDTAGISIRGSAALRVSGRWVSESLYELTMPYNSVMGLPSGVLTLPDSSFSELVFDARDKALAILLSGDKTAGHEPWVHFLDGRTQAQIIWPRRLAPPVAISQQGRNAFTFAVPVGREARVLPTPILANAPVLRLNQRANLLAGPDALFPVVRAALPAGSEGTLTALAPGWVRVRMLGQEGWINERAVTIELISPDYPLSARASSSVTAEIVGIIPPSTAITLRERVDGGYKVTLASGLTGYLLDAQLFLERLAHFPRAGLARAIRFVVPNALPPTGPFERSPFLEVVDVVSHQGGTIFTVGAPDYMHLSLAQSGTDLTLAAGVVLQGLTLTTVPSGQQVSFMTDGAHDLLVRHTSSGLIITIPYAVLGADFSAPPGAPLISSIEAKQSRHSVELSLTLEQPLAYRVFDSRVVTLMSPRLQGKSIVIDPGHGGRDPGALGRLGWDEKDYTLDMARRLAKELERLGAIAVLTHEGIAPATKLPTEARLDVINREQNDLFISIHLNAFGMASLRGAETYYFGQEENLRLARLLQAALVEAGMRDRGVINSRTLALLRRGQPPGVLLELGYLTNPDDERFLSVDGNRDLLARKLAQAVETFFARQK